MRITVVKKIIILLFLMLTVAIVNIVVIYHYHTQQRHDSHIVNVAGRQRMISQRMAKLALSIAIGNDSNRRILEATIRFYDSSLEALWHGGEPMGRHIPAAPKIMEELFKKNKNIWDTLKENAKIVVREPSDNKAFEEAIDHIQDSSDDLLRINDLITIMFENILDRKNLLLRILLLMIVGVDILIFMIGYFLAVTMIVKPLKILSTTAAKIGAGDFTAKASITSNDEIGDLAVSFNKMSAAINGKTNKLIEANMNLQEVHKELLLASRRAGMAEVATDVLHNVGNVLNSINVSTTVIGEMLSDSKVPNLKKVTDIIDDHAQDMGSFFTEDPQGKHIPAYLRKIAKLLTDEQAKIAEEAKALAKNVKHIKEIVKMQQSYSKAAGVKVVTSLAEIIENAIQINNAGLKRHGITFMTEFAELPEVNIDQQRVLQIIVNLISNAKYAASKNQQNEKLLIIRCYRHDEDRLRIEVADNGIGISEENLSKIFSHGFTTKKDGHGFGLHSGALAAKEMGGSLTVYSDGPWQGATFVLELPFEPVGVSV